MIKLVPRYEKGKVIRLLGSEGYLDVPITDHTYKSGTPLGYILPEVTVTPSKQQQASIARKQTAQAWRDFDKNATDVNYNIVRAANYVMGGPNATVMLGADLATDPEMRQLGRNILNSYNSVNNNPYRQKAGWEGAAGGAGVTAVAALSGNALYDYYKSHPEKIIPHLKKLGKGAIGLALTGIGGTIGYFIDGSPEQSSAISNNQPIVESTDSTQQLSERDKALQELQKSLEQYQVKNDSVNSQQ